MRRLFRALDDDEGVTLSLWLVGWATRQRGELQRAEAAYREGLSVATRHGWAREQASCHRGLAQVAVRAGQWQSALEHEREAIALYEQVGHRMGVVYASNGAGEAKRYAGELEQAERWYRRSLELAESVGTTETAFPRINLAQVLMTRGRYEEARPTLERARDVLRRTDRKAFVAGVELCLLACHAGERDWPAFDATFIRAMDELARTRFLDRDGAAAAELAGDLASAAGKEARARRAWDHAREQWRALGDDARLAVVEAKLSAPVGSS